MNGIHDSRDTEPQEDGGAPTQPDGTASPAGSQRATRNITVSIQYSYFTPHRLANLNYAQEASTNDSASNIPGLGGRATNEDSSGMASGLREGGGSGTEAAAAAATAARPDGALVLSFRDVPISTPQERLESIISIAAELAMRRFSDLMALPKGITRDQFEQLPVLQVRNLPEKQNATCSICYENYEDEPATFLKRARDGEDEENEEDMDSVKKRRSESPGSPQTMETAPSHTSSYQEEQGSLEEQQLPSSEGESARKYIHSPIQLPCGHIFGRECLDKWSQMENSCPLCRRKIVEVQAEQRSDNGSGNGATNVEAFERIRQLLYNSPTDQRPGPESEVTEGERTRDSSSNGGTEELDPQSFTISRSGIVFLRPGPQLAAMPANERPPTAIASDNGTTTMEGPSPVEGNSNNSFEPTHVNNSRRIHWMPLPLTSIRMDSGFENQEPQGQHDRLTAILDHIFNAARNDSLQENVDRSSTGSVVALPAVRSPVATIPGPASFANTSVPSESSAASSANGLPVNPNPDLIRSTNAADLVPSAVPALRPVQVAPATSSTSATSEPLEAAPPSPPRRRSFLDNILRITNLNRTFGRSRNNHNSSNDNSSRQANNTGMFNSGVASFRNQNGRVSTFPIHNSPLPSLPLLLRRRQGSNRSNNNNANNVNNSDSSSAHSNRDAST